MTLEQQFKKETGLDAYILNDLRGHIAIDTYVEWLEEKCNIPVVGSSAFLVQHKETLVNFGLFSTRKKAENYINKNTDLFGIQEVKIA